MFDKKVNQCFAAYLSHLIEDFTTDDVLAMIDRDQLEQIVQTTFGHDFICKIAAVNYAQNLQRKGAEAIETELGEFMSMGIIDG